MHLYQKLSRKPEKISLKNGDEKQRHEKPRKEVEEIGIEESISIDQGHLGHHRIWILAHRGTTEVPKGAPPWFDGMGEARASAHLSPPDDFGLHLEEGQGP